MPCSTFPVPGGVAIICHGRGRRRRCSVAGCTDWGERLCDYKLAGSKAGKTCDRALCIRHAKQIEGDDYCPVHARFKDAELAARTAASEPLIVHVMATAKGTRTRCAIERPEYGVQPDVAADPAWGGSVLGLAVCVRCARSSRVKPLPDPPRPRPAAAASGVLFSDPDFRPPTRKDPR